MNIVMFTNTFTPHGGGVARSVEAFSAEYRRPGHQVLVVAPSESIAALLRERGVATAISVVPTGVVLTTSAAAFLEQFPQAHFVLAGIGPMTEQIEGACRDTAAAFSLARCADHALSYYAELRAVGAAAGLQRGLEGESTQ